MSLERGVSHIKKRTFGNLPRLAKCWCLIGHDHEWTEEASGPTASPDASANANPAERKHSTPPTTTAELEKLEARVGQLCVIAENDGKHSVVYFPKPYEYGPKEIRETVERLIHTEATRIALEAIGDMPYDTGRKDGISWPDDALYEAQRLYKEQRQRYATLTNTPEPDHE